MQFITFLCLGVLVSIFSSQPISMRNHDFRPIQHKIKELLETLQKLAWKLNKNKCQNKQL